MAHAKITQARMFDWILACLDTDQPMPTDAAIVDQFNLPSVESARSLLADLADAGQISIKGTGDERVITLGRRATTAETPRPVPSVVKPEGDVDRVSAQIKAILARGKAAVAPVVETPDPVVTSADPVVEIAVPPTDEFPSLAVDDGAQHGSPPADAAPQAVERAPKPSLKTKRLATAPGRGKWPREGAVATKTERRQLNIHFSPDAFDQLAERAKIAGKAPGAHARDMMLALLADDPQPARFRIPASVSAAAILAGRPVFEFAAEMLELGLHLHRRRLAA